MCLTFRPSRRRKRRGLTLVLGVNSCVLETCWHFQELFLRFSFALRMRLKPLHRQSCSELSSASFRKALNAVAPSNRKYSLVRKIRMTRSRNFGRQRPVTLTSESAIFSGWRRARRVHLKSSASSGHVDSYLFNQADRTAPSV